MRFINEILHDKKVNDIDCTEDESAYIKGWLRDTIIKPEDGSQQVLEDIQLHFPLEYNEYLEEMELKDKPKDLIEWIDKVGLPSTKNIITELRALNAQREIISQQTNSVVSIEDAAVNKADCFCSEDGKDILNMREFEVHKELVSCVIYGANWQKEQYNSLLNSYRELLQCIEEIKGECDGHGVINQTWLLNKCQSALNNGDNILSQFKQ